MQAPTPSSPAPPTIAALEADDRAALENALGSAFTTALFDPDAPAGHALTDALLDVIEDRPLPLDGATTFGAVIDLVQTVTVDQHAVETVVTTVLNVLIDRGYATAERVFPETAEQLAILDELDFETPASSDDPRFQDRWRPRAVPGTGGVL